MDIKKKLIAGGLAVSIAMGGIAVDEKIAENKRLVFKEALMSYGMPISAANKISLQFKGGLLHSIIRKENKVSWQEYSDYIKTANKALKDLPLVNGRRIIPMDNGKVKIKDIILKGYMAKNL